MAVSTRLYRGLTAMSAGFDELEAESESWALGRPRTLEDEFAELEAEDAVNAELNELKRRVAQRQ